MKRNTSIQLKAVFLIAVFAMNSVVGFACSLGVKMTFNNKHHHDDEEVTEMAVHIHTDGRKHNHHNKSVKQIQNKKANSKKDDCCNDKVLKISQTDKVVPQSNTLINPFFFTALISSFYSIDVLYSHLQIPNSKYFLQNYHPPIPDIRIVIQSFQI